MEKELIYLQTNELYAHPDNPRKNLGDLTELSDSIKKNGVLQNLTVIPGHWNEKREWIDSGYTIIIGHRRHAGAKNAGLTEVPCCIVTGMDYSTQVETMMVENMQRDDLTVVEQANGFQMMLDLGNTEEQIAEKTGFSKATVKHRLNIAKLDQSILQNKQDEDGFQMSLTDLYALEKVQDIETRNKILKEARNSRDIVSRAENAVAEAIRAANAKSIISMLENLGIQKAPDNAINEIYGSKWKTIKEFELDKEAPKNLVFPKTKEQKYWLQWYRSIRVIVKATNEKSLSKEELARQEREKAKKEIKAILKESTARRKEFIENIITGKIKPLKDEVQEKDIIWQAYRELNAGIYNSTLRRFFLNKDEYSCTEEERAEVAAKVNSLSTLHQMLIILHDSMTKIELYDYYGKFIKNRADALLKGYAALIPYGWYFESEQEKQVLDGSSELYVQENESNK